MDVLKKLFESAVLTDETKTAIEESFNTLRESMRTELEADYEKRLTESTESMLASIPAIVEEAVAEELAAVAEEVASARTLEVEYAEKLTAFKESYAEKQEEQVRVMVAESVAEVVEEMKEEIELAKKHEFALNMFESFKGAYEALFGGADSNVVAELKEAKQELDRYQRKEKMESLLEGLAGDKRSIAETILEGVSTDKLESKFEHIRGVLLSESKKSEKEEPLEEGDKGKTELKGKVVIEEGVIEEGKGAETQDPLLKRLERSIRIGRNMA